MAETIEIDVESDTSSAESSLMGFEKSASSAFGGIEQSANQLGESSDKMGSDMQKTGGRVNKAFTHMHSGAEFLMGGMENLNVSIDAFRNLSKRGEIAADNLARAQLDVEQSSLDVEQAMADEEQAAIDLEQALVDTEQAQLDVSQAQRDSAQAGIDAEQALLDQKVAQQDYNEAVKEFGEGSLEAQQAAIDLTQADEDLKQANLDAEQATTDLTQAELDAEQAAQDMTQAHLDTEQASIDAEGAQLDLNQAHRDAVPPTTMQKWINTISGFLPLIFTAIGAMQLLTAATTAQRIAQVAGTAATGIATAAQWAWNAALIANPIGLIIVAIVAVVAALIILYKKSETARKIMDAVFKAIVAVVKWWFNNIVKRYFALLKKAFDVIVQVAKLWWQGVQKYFNFWKGAIQRIIGWVTGLRDNAKRIFNNIVRFVTRLPRRITSAARGMWDGIWNAFRNIINNVIAGWNNLSFTLPSITVLGQTFGGFTLSTPNIPFLGDGGIITGPTLAMLGETGDDEAVIPLPHGMRDLNSQSRGVRADDLRMPGATGLERIFITWLERLLRKNNLELRSVS